MKREWLTERLVARAPRPGSRDAYRSLFLDPAVGRWLRPAPLTPFEDAEVLALLQRDERHWAEHGFGPWVLTERDGGSTIGRGGLQWVALDNGRAVELLWAVDSDRWNEGLATEAALAAVDWARSLALEEVIALVMPSNDASRRVAEKAGLQLGGEAQHAGLTHLVYRLSLQQPAAGRVLELCQPERRPAEPSGEHGYLDFLGEVDPTGGGLGQRLMTSRVLPLVYQRFWRPVGGRLLMGLTGPGTAEEHRIALEMLSIRPGDRVLDVACGPGNFTRDFARVADNGLVVGADASRTMLDAAVRETDGDNVAYVRADACDLPFRDGSFDAVCCFAALYLIEEPTRAIGEIVRVLAPGGRVALLSSCSRGPIPAPVVGAVVRGLSGVRVFGRDELTKALAGRGLAGIEQRVAGFAQFVSARKRADWPGGT